MPDLCWGSSTLEGVNHVDRHHGIEFPSSGSLSPLSGTMGDNTQFGPSNAGHVPCRTVHLSSLHPPHRKFQSHYTQFMRNPPLLATIATLASKYPRGAGIKIASIGCSTGAELYSVLYAIKIFEVTCRSPHRAQTYRMRLQRQQGAVSIFPMFRQPREASTPQAGRKLQASMYLRLSNSWNLSPMALCG